jgi:hypothetical protein
MEIGSDPGWAVDQDASAVAQHLKGELFSAANAVFERARAVVANETGKPGREDVVQAATTWGTVALTVASGVYNVPPKLEPGLYPGEGIWQQRPTG